MLWYFFFFKYWYNGNSEEEEKFIKEITDFNNEYELTKKRELLMKENVKIQISDLENQANILKMGMKT